MFIEPEALFLAPCMYKFNRNIKDASWCSKNKTMLITNWQFGPRPLRRRNDPIAEITVAEKR